MLTTAPDASLSARPFRLPQWFEPRLRDDRGEHTGTALRGRTLDGISISQRRQLEDDQGFTLVEVIVAGAMLSVLVLCLIQTWAVCNRLSFDLLLRQKAVFVLGGEMERLASLYNTTTFGALPPASSGGYPSLANIPNSATRSIYPTRSLPFVTSASATFLTDDTYVWSSGSPGTRNFVWLDRDRGVLARLSWIGCAVSASTVSNTAQACWTRAGKVPKSPPGTPFACYNGLVAKACQLLTLVLDYPYRLQDDTPVQDPQSPALRTMTLNTIVGRRR